MLPSQVIYPINALKRVHFYDYYCNGEETCDPALGCQDGTAVVCSGLSNEFNDRVCDEATDGCMALPKIDGTSCEDGFYCNGVETCVSGICQDGTAVVCDDGIACTDDSCNELNNSCDFVEITSCVYDDGCCPNGCDYTNDNDCCGGSGAPCTSNQECCKSCDKKAGVCR